MTKKQYNELRNDEDYISIHYESSYSHGDMIMKKSLFELRKKKIDRLLKDCISWVNVGKVNEL